MSDIEYGTGKYSTRAGRAEIRSLVSLSWDSDIQGSALSHLFGVCETLNAFGEIVPDECEFSPSPMHNSPDDIADEWPDAEYVQMFTDDQVTPDDLQYWARVLNRYVALIPADRRY